MDNTFESPSVLSICTGIRGLERGIERAVGPLRAIAYVEIEAFIIENLLAGMEAGILAPAPIWANLKTFPWRFFRGKVDILLGGYPCQPFSIAGKQLGKADPRHLWPFIESGVRTGRPFCCFFENVAAHLNCGYREVKRSLEEMGYVVKEGIYAAEEVGAPHRRERLFILGVLANAEYPSWWPSIRSEELDNAGCIGHGQVDTIPAGWDSTEPAGEKLADPEGIPERKSTGFPVPITNEREAREITSRRSAAMADPCGPGLEGYWPRANSSGSELSMPSSSGGDRWPSRPGELQQAWESPRLISRTSESSMGLSVDGYNFREDLLRALGNGVVEQQAEFAFRDLMRKHFA